MNFLSLTQTTFPLSSLMSSGPKCSSGLITSLTGGLQGLCVCVYAKKKSSGKTPHLYSNCWLGRICSNLLVFFSLKVSTAGEGLLVNTLMIPMGNESVISPVIFTMHLLNNTGWVYYLLGWLPTLPTKLDQEKREHHPFQHEYEDWETFFLITPCKNNVQNCTCYWYLWGQKFKSLYFFNVYVL